MSKKRNLAPGQRVFFLSDTHFGHASIIKTCARPFADLDEMHRKMILDWNSVVTRNDIVFFLGDFSFKMKKPAMQKVFDQLKGEKHLIQGNHDHDDTRGLGWASVADQRTVVVDGERFVCNHYPQREWDYFYHGAYHLFGHSHSRMPGSARAIDVGVDNIGFVPQTAAQLKARMELLPDLIWRDGQPFVREPKRQREVEVEADNETDDIGFKI